MRAEGRLVPLSDRLQNPRAPFREKVDPAERIGVDVRLAQHRAAPLQIETPQVSFDDVTAIDVVLRVKAGVRRRRFLREDEELASDALRLPEERAHRVHDRSPQTAKGVGGKLLVLDKD